MSKNSAFLFFFMIFSVLMSAQIKDIYLNIPDQIIIMDVISTQEEVDGKWRIVHAQDNLGNAVIASFRLIDNQWIFNSVSKPLNEREMQWFELPWPTDMVPFLVAQFGCPHSDVDMNALNNPKFNWKPRKPFERGVLATIKADKICDVYHVLGDWSGQQVLNEKDATLRENAIRDDIIAGREIFIKNTQVQFEMKSIAGNHISKFYAQDKNDASQAVVDKKSYALYKKAVQETMDNFPDTTRLKIHRDASLNYDYEWESYYYIKGNNLFFFLSDRNDVDAPWGKKNSIDENGEPLKGGHPAGAIRKSSLDFFVDVAIKNADKNIFLHTHQGLPNTVVGTSTKINGWKGHNDSPEATKKWKGTIGALVDPEQVHNGAMRIEQNDSIFNLLFNQWDQLVVGCANSHTHAPVNYRSNPFFTGNEGEDAHSVNNDHYSWLNKTFIMNVGNLTRHHGHYAVRKNIMHPHGSIWEFTPQLDSMTAHKLIVEDVLIYKTNFRAKRGDLYVNEEKKYKLKYPFSPNFRGVDPIQPDPITDLKIEHLRDSIKISFSGKADAYAVVSSEAKIKFVPSSFSDEVEKHTGKTYVPTYSVSDDECPSCEVLRYQGTSDELMLPKSFTQKTWNEKGIEMPVKLNHNYFKIFALNGANGKVIYSEGVEVKF